ncbi:DoxX family protein [Brevundimonas sp. R86498]|uniref:DoxX family protein n=1 Tax=Brevundimonas sp. R86498 TaxID=3093845 RepID=UPI0037C5C0F3
MRLRPPARWILIAAYLAAGILHVLAPAPFLGITPGWVPFAPTVILITGLAEIAGAIGLIIPRLRRAAGLGLALYAACVFPANIQHAINDLTLADPQLGWAYHGPRLLFQPVIVWWALWVGEVTDWPFRRRQAA